MLLKKGMLAKSKAGHDRDRIYVMIDIESEYVYVADGERYPLCRMKKKNRKHLQPILKVQLSGEPDDAAIRGIIREYAAEH